MAKTVKTAKGFNNENPFPEQEAAKKAKDVKTPKVKTTTNTSSNSVKLDKKLVKGINKSITKGVKAAKKAAKKSAKKRQTARQKAATEKKKKYLKEMNDWAREQLKAAGYDAKTSAKLRKGYREHLKDRRISSMSTKTRHKEIMQYIQAKAQAATGITYQELNNLLKNKVIHNYKSDNYREVYYQITEYAGETAYTDINRYKNEYVTAEELERIINTFKDKGPAKDTKGLRKTIRIQVDMFIKNKSTVSGMVGAYTPDEWEKLRETSEPDFVTEMTKQKRKKKRK